jgi:glycosyltransferase involved in cell wall biosynthesis
MRAKPTSGFVQGRTGKFEKFQTGRLAIMKNLLMVIPFFPPMAGGGVYRPLSFVKYLGEFGWTPTVLAPASQAFWINDASLVEYIPPACEVSRTRTLSAQSLLAALRMGTEEKQPKQVRSSMFFAFLRKLGSIALIPDSYAGWYPFAVREGMRILKRKGIDMIYSTSPPETSHLIALKLHKASGLPWVADFRDPWMNLHLFKPPTPLHGYIHTRLENKVINAAAVVVANRWHYEFMRKRKNDPHWLKIIVNGYDRDEVEAVAGVRPPMDKFRILHAGMLTQKRSAEPFLRALRRFIDQNPGSSSRMEAVFLGPREDRNELMVKKLGLEHVVVFKNTVTHGEAVQLERASHVLLLIKHLDPLYHGIIPGKVYEYIGVSRPILALVPEGEAKELILGLNRGEVVSQDDEERIAEKIGLLFEKALSGNLDSGYDLSFLPQYERKTLTGELADYLDLLLTAQRGNAFEN